MKTAVDQKPCAPDASEERSIASRMTLPDAGGRERFTINDLTREFGVTARALRHYENEELISPIREGLNRIYTKRDRARLAWILRAKNVGFSLSEIREMLDLYDLNDGRVEQRRVTIQRCHEKIEKLTQQKADIESAIEELTDAVTYIESLLDQNEETKPAKG